MYGALIVDGSPSRVTFTSSSGNAWMGIAFVPGSGSFNICSFFLILTVSATYDFSGNYVSGSRLTSCDFFYAGVNGRSLSFNSSSPYLFDVTMSNMPPVVTAILATNLTTLRIEQSTFTGGYQDFCSGLEGYVQNLIVISSTFTWLHQAINVANFEDVSINQSDFLYWY